MPDVACARCGQIHTRCIGHNRTGGPCQNYPRTGQRVCRPHGANSPQALAAAERRMAEAKLEQEIVRAATTGPLPLLEPGTTLLEAVAMLAQGVTYLRSHIADQESPSGEDLESFFRQVERLARIAKLADDARLGERRLAHEERLTERYLLQLETFIDAFVRRLDTLVRSRLELTGGVVVLDPLDPEVQEAAHHELAAIDGTGGTT